MKDPLQDALSALPINPYIDTKYGPVYTAASVDQARDVLVAALTERNA